MKPVLPILLLALAACSTTGAMRDARPTPPPGPDEAKVVVYRTAAFGGGDHFPVFELSEGAGKLLGFTETDCFFEVRCPPGRHRFIASGEGDAFVDADLDGGRTYFIRAYSKFGLASSRPGFAPVPRDSQEWLRLDEILRSLHCRELDPATAARAERRLQDCVREAESRLEESRRTPRFLKPEDGRPEEVLPAK